MARRVAVPELCSCLRPRRQASACKGTRTTQKNLDQILASYTRTFSSASARVLLAGTKQRKAVSATHSCGCPQGCPANRPCDEAAPRPAARDDSHRRRRPAPAVKWCARRAGDATSARRRFHRRPLRLLARKCRLRLRRRRRRKRSPRRSSTTASSI